MTPNGGGGDCRAWPATSFAPLFIVGAWQLLNIAALLLSHAWLQEDLMFVNRSRFGQDFLVYFQAAEKIAAGESPYAVSPYVTPPLPAQLLAPMTALTQETAARAFAELTSVALLLGLYLTARWSWPHATSAQLRWTAGCAIAMGAGFPFLFLFERGNIDGFVALALFAAISMTGRHATLAGLLLAVAVSLKLYPALLLLPLVVFRQWRVLASYLVAQLVLIAVAPLYWRQFVDERLRWRMEEFYTVEENGSIFSLFHFLGQAAEWTLQGLTVDVSVDGVFQGLAALVYIGLLAAAVAADFRAKTPVANLPFRLALYVPFMAAVPRVAYVYELVLLLPLLPILGVLWIKARSTRMLAGAGLASAGIALAQTHIVAWRWLLDTPAANAAAALGLFMVVVGAVLVKWSPEYAQSLSGGSAAAGVASTSMAKI
ncbi:MAG: glycosyltransferase family 87 protein [Candidatus Hydrogenedentales bacterium]